MTNTSATGGYLLPSGAAPLSDDALIDFLQAWIVGITGIAGKYMRPRWQDEPPNIPNFGVTWGALGVVMTREIVNGAQEFDPAANGGNGAVIVTMQKELDVMLSAYGPGCDGLCNDFRSGAQLAQNREPLVAAGFGLVKIGGNTIAPEKIKQRWWSRTDVTFTIRQELRRVYPVFSIESAHGSIETNLGSADFIVTGDS